MPEAKSYIPSNYNTLASNILEEPVEDRGFWGDLADTYALGVYGQISDTLERRNYRNVIDPNFDPLNNIPMGYGQYAPDMRYARTQDELDLIIRNIDENNAIRARQQDYSFGYNFLLGAIAGVFDPVNLLGPSVKGASFLSGAAKGALVYGSLNAGQELIRNELDPTSTNLETSFNIGAGYLLSGLIVGGVSHFSKTNLPKTKIDSKASEQAKSTGDSFDRAISALDDLADPENLKFNDQDVKIVYGSTGKYDASGNYIPATFRSAKSAAEIARRAKVKKAADDILGDVIPDDEAATVVNETATVVKFDRVTKKFVDVPVSRKTQVDRPQETEGFSRVSDEVPSDKIDESFEDTIYIDDGAILDAFESKPWTSPRVPGVEPFAEDAFKTPAEYLNFVVRHELHHATTKRLKNESKVDYENRINRLA